MANYLLYKVLVNIYLISQFKQIKKILPDQLLRLLLVNQYVEYIFKCKCI